MTAANYYHILNVEPTATQAEIKRAYRALAKQFHPDSHHKMANHERIAQINEAYAVLKDPRQRQGYDRRNYNQSYRSTQPRAARASDTHQKSGRTTKAAQASDAHLQSWIRQVYTPVNRRLNQILKQLKSGIRLLSQDPFDDELMADFQTYLEESRASLTKAQRLFQSMPNPAAVAGVAAHLYHCLSHLEDGIDELERFTMCYDDYYLNTGRELFRLSGKLRIEAQAAMRAVS